MQEVREAMMLAAEMISESVNEAVSKRQELEKQAKWNRLAGIILIVASVVIGIFTGIHLFTIIGGLIGLLFIVTSHRALNNSRLVKPAQSIETLGVIYLPVQAILSGDKVYYCDLSGLSVAKEFNYDNIRDFIDCPI